jgi:bla regulator protein blaR1
MNIIESLVSAEFIRAFAWTLLNSLWQGGLLALLTAGLLVTLRKYRPGIRYAFLYIMLLLIPVFFTGTFFLTYNPHNIEVLKIAENDAGLWQTDNNLAGNIHAVSMTDVHGTWYTYTVHLFENQAKWLVLIWFTGFFIFLLRFSGSIIYVYRLKTYQVYQVDDPWNYNLRKLAEKIGMRKPVWLAESALARIPMTIGYLKPVILLPLGTLSGVPPQQIDAIILHELAHILRKDYLLNIIQSFIELLFFYHPVTWWLSGLIRQEREHICDDLAVAVNQDHINYIKALTTMEELNSKAPLLASAITGSRKKLLCRVKRLLSPVKLRKGISEGIIVFILLVGLIFALSVNALSFIPSAYDLKGRESGEKVYNFLPYKTNAQPETIFTEEITPPKLERLAVTETPDTIISRSKSGKVTISVYTDSTSHLQQEQLDRMAESMDIQAQQLDHAREQYRVQMEKNCVANGNRDKECKVIVISKSDSTDAERDSVIVISNGSVLSLKGGDLFDWHLPVPPDCPVPPDAQMFKYYYSNPDMHGLEDCKEKFFSIEIDSIDGINDLDTVIYIGPEGRLFFDNKNMEWSSKEFEREMRGFGMDMERQQYNDTPVSPNEPRWVEHGKEQWQTPDERIIRQELIDDGLASPHKKYVIDIDSHSMYINGEKQSKDIFRKYKHLVQSLEITDFEGDGTYRLIF